MMIKDALLGVAVGDALGVPVEFENRHALTQNPVTGMMGYGTYNVPAGTWSDDSSLTFCLAEALTEDFDLDRIATTFQNWLFHNYWTPHGEVFDVGIATRQAIARLAKGIRADLAGGFHEDGNGSLMRILPLVFYLRDKSLSDRYQLTKTVSSITHGHIRSVIACFYYLEFARQLLQRNDKLFIYEHLKTTCTEFLISLSIDPSEISLFNRILQGNIQDLPIEEIQSSGYVLHTLEASIWCLLTTNSYREAVLKAVNLGQDTDTTAAVTGGLAGLLYGSESIPASWVNQLARRNDIESLAQRLTKRLAG